MEYFYLAIKMQEKVKKLKIMIYRIKVFELILLKFEYFENRFLLV